MKVKIVRSGNDKILVVDDAEINNAYRFSSKDHPIVLGVITHFFNSGFYSLQDYRRKNHLIPSRYLDDGVEEALIKSPEDRERIISELHTYKEYEKDGKHFIVWHPFNSYCFEGDLNKEESFNPVACFSYKEAYKRLKEQRDFWLEYPGKDLTADCIRLANPKRQPTYSEISFKEIMRKIEAEKAQKAQDSGPSLTSLD